MTGHTQSYPDNPELRQDAATERQFLEENIATVAFHLGQPGAKLSVRSDKNSYNYIVNGRAVDLCRFADIALAGDATFGAALDRARKALVA